MERIYLDCIKSVSEDGFVRVAVYLKDVLNEHFNDLVGFLRNQNVECYELNEAERIRMDDFEAFDEGFSIEFAAKRWSLFQLRNYIYKFLDGWEDDILFCGDYSTIRQVKFNDEFYVELSRRIDQCEDRYYNGNYSTALFIDGILRILRDNLQLNWAAAKLADYRTDKLTYLNYSPSSIARKTIISSCASGSIGPVRIYPVIFDECHIADFYLSPSPQSPQSGIIDKFIEYVIMHIDDFLYGALQMKKEAYQLKCRIAELEKENRILLNRLSEFTPEPIENKSDFPVSERSLEDARLILIGATELNQDKILSEFKRAGFKKKNIVIHIDYDKMHRIDINDLKRMRSKFDGILLGPMPHKMSGDMSGASLIGMVKNNREDYPPFAVCTERSGTLKITKNSLKAAINELVPKLENYNNYAKFV